MSYSEQYQKWLDSPALSEEEWAELNAISEDEAEKRDRFFASLEFGTAGLRGTMKVGLHNMNVHIIRHATQAFADVIVEEGPEACEKGIIIDHDCRMNGRQFAEEAACVMAANGIHVRIFDSLRPTPELSFAVRHFGACAGLNITASHNPKEYNGYKVYWSDGAQLPPQKAEKIAQRMRTSDVFTSFRSCDFSEAVAAGTIELIGAECDEAFLQEVLAMSVNREYVKAAADELKIVYTPFHGCGYRMVPEALNRLGVKHLYPVPEQMVIDGTFPTVVSPNPENPEGFYLAVELAKTVGSNLIIGTDPDADRIGILVKQNETFVPVTGNQLGVLLLDYLIKAKKETYTLPENAGAVASIVTTSMARAVCERHGVHFEDTFTGFKFMAERIAEWEKEGTYRYIFAYEESYGYMMGDYVRDKDAVTAAVLVAEMAAYYAQQKKTLLDALDDLFRVLGVYKEKTLNIVMPGADGIEKMAQLMNRLRSDPPTELAGIKAARIRDYSDGSVFVVGLGKVDKTPIQGSNVLFFEMADGCNFIIRPSGTEPKIKIYILARGENDEICSARIQQYELAAAELIK